MFYALEQPLSPMFMHYSWLTTPCIMYVIMLFKVTYSCHFKRCISGMMYEIVIRWAIPKVMDGPMIRSAGWLRLINEQVQMTKYPLVLTV